MGGLIKHDIAMVAIFKQCRAQAKSLAKACEGPVNAE
jgi:hypothetical protein